MASQWLIGIVEILVGTLLIAAAIMPARRLVLSQGGLGLPMALFSAFAITMFAMHEPTLPEWNQSP